MIIEFGRWQLRPDKPRANWMLALTKDWESRGRHKGGGSTPRQVRYFQWSNIGNAFMYAASRDLMDKDGTMDAYDAARELEAILTSHIYLAQRCMDNYADPLAKSPTARTRTPEDGTDG